ncbi:MAG: porin family protein [Alphaproteobacteria bacterium]|nr:porin family protein [Alphaproteobacteria bacterium]
MKMFFFLMVLLLTAPARAERADEGFYTRIDAGGLYSTKTPLKKGTNVQMGFGQRWAEVFRGEFTFEYTRIIMKGPRAYNGAVGHVRTHLPSWTAMVTGYVDLFDFEGVVPYVGAGFGVSRNDTPNATADGRRVFGDSRFRPAWKITGGIGINLPKNLTLDIGYTYADLGDFSTKSSLPPVLKQDVKIRKVNVGLRYNF